MSGRKNLLAHGAADGLGGRRRAGFFVWAAAPTVRVSPIATASKVAHRIPRLLMSDRSRASRCRSVTPRYIGRQDGNGWRREKPRDGSPGARVAQSMQTAQPVLSTPPALDEGDALRVDVLGAGEQVAPDPRGRGEVRQRRPNASIISQPSYLTSLSVLNVASQFTCPVPGVPRSFSLMWTWASTGATVRIAAAGSFSSMWAWKVSYIVRKFGWFTVRTSSTAAAAVFRK